MGNFTPTLTLSLHQHTFAVADCRIPVVTLVNAIVTFRLLQSEERHAPV